MGSLLDRPLIQKDFDNKYPVVVHMMNILLDEVKIMYDDQIAKKESGYAPTHKNMPVVSGSLRWAKELRDRMSIPMSNFKHIEHP